METARFTLTGASFTDVARHMVLEGRWENAMALFTEGLQGDPETARTAAFRVLQGTHRLTGDSHVGLTLEEDPDGDHYHRELNRAFAGRFRLPLPDSTTVWVRPIARITNYGPEDASGTPAYECEKTTWRERVTTHGTAKGRGGRALHYTVSPREHVVLVDDHAALGGAVALVVEECGSPPIWMTTALTKKPAEALAEWENTGHRVEERGYSQWYVRDRRIPTIDEDEDATVKRVPVIPPAAAGRDAFDAAQAIREAAFDAEVAAAKTRIIAAADAMPDGWLDIEVRPDDGDANEDTPQNRQNFPDCFGFAPHTLRIPRAPFIHWALRGLGATHLAPPWIPVCGPGWKMNADDVNHTDWVVGAGLAIHNDHTTGPVGRAIQDTMGRIQHDMLGFTATVLSGSGVVSGKIVHPARGETVSSDCVAVIPCAHPDFLPAVTSAAATVTAEGGSVCHLANVGRERGIILLRVPNAVSAFPPGHRVIVDAGGGRVELCWGVV